MVTCRLTACTPGSAPGPTLGVEYGKPLPFFFYRFMCSELRERLGVDNIITVVQ